MEMPKKCNTKIQTKSSDVSWVLTGIAPPDVTTEGGVSLCTNAYIFTYHKCIEES